MNVRGYVCMYVEVVVRLSRIYGVPSIHILPHVDYHYIITYTYSRPSIESYLFLISSTAVFGGCGCCIAGELAVVRVPYSLLLHYDSG